MKKLASIILAASVTGCAGPSWPEKSFPAKMSVERVLFAEGDGLLREGCRAIVAELTDAAATRVIYAPKVVKEGPNVASPANGWSPTPITENADKRTYYEGAFSGCNDDGRRPLGDLPGALKQPGSFYKVINDGEGILIIAPHAKLAGLFYFG
jgi:hypothetical protein